MTTSTESGRVVQEVRTLLDAQGDPDCVASSDRRFACWPMASRCALPKPAGASGLPVDHVDSALRATGDVDQEETP